MGGKKIMNMRLCSDGNDAHPTSVCNGQILNLYAISGNLNYNLA